MTIDEWTVKEKDYSARLQEIIIPEDVEPATIKMLISQIDRLRSEAFDDYVNAKTLYHSMDRRIDIVMRSVNQGSNDIERKANQVRAAREFSLENGQVVNLFEVRDIYYRRYIFMESLMSQIKAKADSLITDSNVLATEAKLVQ